MIAKIHSIKRDPVGLLHVSAANLEKGETHFFVNKLSFNVLQFVFAHMLTVLAAVSVSRLLASSNALQKLSTANGTPNVR